MASTKLECANVEDIEIEEYCDGDEVVEQIDAMSTLLSAFGPTVGRLANEFRKHALDYNTLAALTEYDLERLGVKSAKHRADMLNEFAQLPNQAEHYDQIEFDPGSESHNETVLTQNDQHLDSLTAALTAARLAFYINPVEDILATDNDYSSTFVLRTIDIFQQKIVEIQQRLAQLKGDSLKDGVSAPIIVHRQSNRLTKFLVVGAASCLASFLFARYYFAARR